MFHGSERGHGLSKWIIDSIWCQLWCWHSVVFSCQMDWSRGSKMAWLTCPVPWRGWLEGQAQLWVSPTVPPVHKASLEWQSQCNWTYYEAVYSFPESVWSDRTWLNGTPIVSDWWNQSRKSVYIQPVCGRNEASLKHYQVYNRLFVWKWKQHIIIRMGYITSHGVYLG